MNDACPDCWPWRPCAAHVPCCTRCDGIVVTEWRDASDRTICGACASAQPAPPREREVML
jgi:hypothetical protein